jgi:hypothetical protein
MTIANLIPSNMPSTSSIEHNLCVVFFVLHSLIINIDCLQGKEYLHGYSSYIMVHMYPYIIAYSFQLQSREK